MQPACNNYEYTLTHSANDKAQGEGQQQQQQQEKGQRRGGGMMLRDQLIFQLDIFSI